MADAKKNSDKISEGIISAFDQFLTNNKPAASTPNLEMESVYKNSLWAFARKMNTFYQYVKSDAESARSLNKNILEELADGLANAKDQATKLDAQYKTTLIPGLAANLGAAMKIRNGFSSILELSKDLSKDIHEDDRLFSELVETLVENGADKEAKVKEEKEKIKGQVPKGKDPLGIGPIEEKIAALVKNLDDLLKNEFILIDIPSVLEFFNQTADASAKLDADLTANLAALAKEEDDSMAAFLAGEAKKAHPGHVKLWNDMEALKPATSNVTGNTSSTNGKNLSPLEAAGKSKNDSEQMVADLKKQLEYEEAEKNKSETYEKQLNATEALVKALSSGIANLNDVLIRALKGDGGPKKVTLNSVYESLKTTGGEMIAQLQELSAKEAKISFLNEKFADKAVVSDVKEYVTRINAKLGGISDPAIAFVQKMLENVQSLRKITDLADALNVTFTNLDKKMKNSSLAKVSEKIADVKGVLNSPKEIKQLNKTVDELRKEMEDAQKVLAEAQKKYNLEKNKADFEKSIQAAV